MWGVAAHDGETAILNTLQIDRLSSFGGTATYDAQKITRRSSWR